MVIHKGIVLLCEDFLYLGGGLYLHDDRLVILNFCPRWRDPPPPATTAFTRYFYAASKKAGWGATTRYIVGTTVGTWRRNMKMYYLLSLNPPKMHIFYCSAAQWAGLKKSKQRDGETGVGELYGLCSVADSYKFRIWPPGMEGKQVCVCVRS